jgi:hypothetical protein
MANKRLPTDLEILNTIYEEYYEEYEKFDRGQSTRKIKVYVPLDIAKIAEKLGTEKDIVYGRLNYHLNKKYSYKKDDEKGSKVLFFAHTEMTDDPELEKDHIQFPYMASVLADLRQEHGKAWRAYRLAVASLIISLVSLSMTLAKTLTEIGSRSTTKADVIQRK